ncbi:MAG TPA: hypothetical protein PKW15_04335 [Alphaproteobacteria bacterium]|nr:hypothetical protein [Rhodospirillaceae bacterium]HRJ12455.1 hypothetical protein [Alphaproteobacteria bacterium]
MRPFFLMLYGFPAAGKYTIAKEIAARTGARLIDNHLINNPIFQVMRTDGKSGFAEEVWDYVGKIRELVFDCIAQFANPEDSFIFTNVLVEETKNDGDRILLEKIHQMAITKQVIFIPVRLECKLETAQKRVNSPERKAKIKMTDPDALAEIYQNYHLLNVDYPYLLTLETSELDAPKAAAYILKHIETCQNREK